MAMHKWKDIKGTRLSAAKVKEIEASARAEVLEMNLRALREFVGKTQVELAAAMKVEQAALSRSERSEDHLLSTLRKYVEALGGELDVVAKFGDTSIRLHGV